MKVAAIQMIAGSNLDDNLSQARELLNKAACQGVELAVLPEYFCLIGSKDSEKLDIAETFGEGKIQSFLSQIATELGIWLVGGTIPIRTVDPQRVRNSTLVFSPNGECVSRYDKIHLFRFDNNVESYDESMVLESGKLPVVFNLPSKDGHLWRIGLSVCYDLRFPELYRSQQADAWLVPSAFTHTTGMAHWDVLLRARAIENLTFIIAAAQGGMHPSGRETWGHSMVVSPWGEVKAFLEKGVGVVVAETDIKHLQTVRHQLQALQHRAL
ncbi:MAG TPA: carbon-nitrogen hydrolase family protein [Burkholderiaceae bacterium]|nr:carbon-nitrogen hydrolase family protein [Burkholderiaceae bacterium]